MTVDQRGAKIALALDRLLAQDSWEWQCVGEAKLELDALLAEQQYERERDKAFDQGVESFLGEIVCSVCGQNHDRDESAACEGCEAIRFDEWIQKAETSLAKVSALVELARRARSQAAAPEYDEEAIRDALWALVDAVLVEEGSA